nr:G protein-coupled receptor [Proales similis]
MLRDESLDLIGRVTTAVLYVEMGVSILLNTVSVLFIVLTRSFSTTYILILNLAIADIFYASCIPYYVRQFSTNVVFNKLFTCRLFYMLDVVSMMAIVFTTALLAIERYQCLSNKKVNEQGASVSKRRRLFLIYLLAIWIVSIIFALPRAVNMDEGDFNNQTICVSKLGPSQEKFFTMFTWIVAFLVPYLVIFVFSAFILRFLRNWSERTRHLYIKNTSKLEESGETRKKSNGFLLRQSLSNRSQPSGNHQMKKKLRMLKKTTVFVMAVIVAFLACWTPLWISQIWLHFSKTESFVIFMTNLVSTVVVYLGGIFNPLLHLILSNNFREQISRCIRLSKRQSV